MTRALIVSVVAVFLLFAAALFFAWPRTTPPPPKNPAAVCAPAGDTYAGDGDPAGAPCDGV